ncbi:MAG: Uma2 family endonuclease [Planctomycetes bacterium]|nr:Uma2 family endonuclease [Planctomycetota bacterium]
MRHRPILPFMPRDSHQKTADDYFALDDDECRTELIEGEFVVSPAPVVRHQAAIAMLVAILIRQVKPLGLGWVFGGPLDSVLSPKSVVHPDVLFVATANLSRLMKCLEGPPDLAVEFLSPSNPENDLNRKMKLYLRHGVPQYWIGDVDAKTIRVLENGGDHWIERGTFGPEAVIRPAGMAGVEVSVAEVYSFPG